MWSEDRIGNRVQIRDLWSNLNDAAPKNTRKPRSKKLKDIGVHSGSSLNPLEDERQQLVRDAVALAGIIQKHDDRFEDWMKRATESKAQDVQSSESESEEHAHGPLVSINAPARPENRLTKQLKKKKYALKNQSESLAEKKKKKAFNVEVTRYIW